MITNSKQTWEVGSTVKVGFLSGLEVTAKVPTPGDWAPDAYVLRRNDKAYLFTPHKGIEGIPERIAQEYEAA